MKYFWAILLLCITLGNAYPNKEGISKFLKLLIEMKKESYKLLMTQLMEEMIMGSMLLLKILLQKMQKKI